MGDNKNTFCPILHRVLKDHSTVERLRPEDMDKLGEEIGLVFQRCAIPESEICDVASDDEGKLDEDLIYSIETISHLLARRANNSMDSRDGALLMLYHDTVITVTNIQALFRMCDPNKIRTSRVRCQALSILNVYSNKPTYDFLIPADVHGEAPMSFGKKLISVMVTVLTQKAYCKHTKGQKNACVCWGVPWTNLAISLNQTLALAHEKPADMLNLLDSFHWPLLLQPQDTNDEYAHRHARRMVFYDESVFINLHHWACRVLADDPVNTKAKTFLKEQLGSCHELLRKCLHRIIAGEIGGGTPLRNSKKAPPAASTQMEPV